MITGGAIATVLALAACGSGTGGDDAAAGDDSEAPWAGLTGAERESALREAAEAEGTLSVYSSYNDEQSMADAFAEKYGLDVEVYNANSESVLQRVTQEVKAGNAKNDVLVAPATDMEAIAPTGVLGDYESEYRDAISDKGKGDQWTGVRRLAFVAGWNTDALDESEIPTDYLDFADPKWKGRLSLELSDYTWYATLKAYYTANGVDEEDFEDAFAAIAANADVQKGHSLQGDMLEAGSIDVALSLYTQTVDRGIDDSAPITLGEDGPRVGPVVVRYDVGAVMAGTDNPAGAQLYLDFQLSEPGFEVDRSLFGLPPIETENDRLGDAVIVEEDVPDMVARRDEVTGDYDDLLQNKN